MSNDVDHHRSDDAIAETIYAALTHEVSTASTGSPTWIGAMARTRRLRLRRRLIAGSSCTVIVLAVGFAVSTLTHDSRHVTVSASATTTTPTSPATGAPVAHGMTIANAIKAAGLGCTNATLEPELGHDTPGNPSKEQVDCDVGDDPVAISVFADRDALLRSSSSIQEGVCFVAQTTSQNLTYVEGNNWIVFPERAATAVQLGRALHEPLRTIQCSAGPAATGPTDEPTVSSTTAPPTFAATPRCRVDRLQAAGNWQGAGGAMAGEIWLTNTGTTPCSLSGRPSIRLSNQRGEQLDVQAHYFEDGRPDAWVTLQPGVERGAQFSVVWSNWCGAATPLTVQVVLPQSNDTLRVSDRGFSSRPRCDNRGASSGIAVGHFEAPSS